MSFVTLSRRMEIAFWISWVSTLRLARATRWLPLLLALSVCMVSLLFVTAFTGYHSAAGGPFFSAAAGQMPPAERPQPEHAPAAQQNTLLLIVDRLEGGPAHLEGAWLLVSDLDLQEIVFLPIYPSRTPGKPGSTQDLSLLFHQNASGAPGESFLEALRQKRIWWNQYVMLDHASLAALVELSGGVSLEGAPDGGAPQGDAPQGDAPQGGGPALDWLTSSKPDPAAFLERQTVLLQALCRQSGRLAAAAHPDLMSGLLLSGGRSDLRPAAFGQQWQQVQRSGSLACEFPILPGGGQ